MTRPDITVIVSTYNAPRALELVLAGYFLQHFSGSFELVIADDGSTEETAALIQALAEQSPVPIQHVWQPDEGFQKCRILNKAIVKAQARILLFTDGDCIPQPNMLQVHLDRSRPRHFLTGGYLKLPPQISEIITKSSIEDRSVFSPSWLVQNGYTPSLKLLKLIMPKPLDRLANRMTPTKRTWNGHNASCYSKDAIAVNGFNEQMRYGGEDVEFGVRLNHLGLQGRHLRYSTIPLHLFHAHHYVTTGMIEANQRMLMETRRSGTISATDGIRK
jgi:glycosyltransferase involved in cell wall biosynthesis